MRWRKVAEDMDGLISLQSQLLNAAARYNLSRLQLLRNENLGQKNFLFEKHQHVWSKDDLIGEFKILSFEVYILVKSMFRMAIYE